MANMTPKTKRNKKERLIAMYGPYCCYCGKYLTRAEMTIEHLIAKRDGGTNAIDNLRLACYYCNHYRHNNIWINHPNLRIPACGKNRTI